MKRKLALLLVALLPALPLFPAPTLLAQSTALPSPSRGELLYETHCIACHSTSVHWRDQKLATDFAGLLAQVARWEKNTGLGWSSEEILDVTGYLNTTIYRFPDTTPQQKG
jgi:mono/diheme cytochrome c family protein